MSPAKEEQGLCVPPWSQGRAEPGLRGWGGNVAGGWKQLASKGPVRGWRTLTSIKLAFNSRQGPVPGPPAGSRGCP